MASVLLLLVTLLLGECSAQIEPSLTCSGTPSILGCIINALGGGFSPGANLCPGSDQASAQVSYTCGDAAIFLDTFGVSDSEQVMSNCNPQCTGNCNSCDVILGIARLLNAPQEVLDLIQAICDGQSFTCELVTAALTHGGTKSCGPVCQVRTSQSAFTDFSGWPVRLELVCSDWKPVFQADQSGWRWFVLIKKLASKQSNQARAGLF